MLTEEQIDSCLLNTLLPADKEVVCECDNEVFIDEDCR